MGKRILIDCTDIFLSNKNSGIQRVAKNICGNFKRLGLDVQAVFLSRGKIYSFNLEDLCKDAKENQRRSKHLIVKSILTKLIEKLPYRAIYYLQRKILELNPPKINKIQLTDINKDDIIILADLSWGRDIWKSLQYAKKNGACITPIIYDLIQINYPHLVRKCYTKIFRDWLNRLFELSDSFICISEAVKNELIEYYKVNGYKIDSKHFSSFKLGCDFKQNDYNLNNVRQHLTELFDKKSTYLMVSTIEPRKNHLFLLNTFSKLWNQGVDAQLCIVGKDSGKVPKTIRAMINHPQYNHKLYWFDDFNDDELIYCYKNSKALVFPSIVEGFGLPIVEGLYFGLPVLASDTPVHREVGNNMIKYFSLDNHNELVGIIERIEEGIESLPMLYSEKLKLTTWEESAKDFFEQILFITNQY